MTEAQFFLHAVVAVGIFLAAASVLWLILEEDDSGTSEAIREDD